MKKVVLFFIICLSVMKGFSQFNNLSDFNVPGVFPGGGRIAINGDIGAIEITTSGENIIARAFERIFAKINAATNSEVVEEAIRELESIWESMESSEKAKFKTAYKQLRKYAKSRRKSLKKAKKRK